MTTAGKLWLGFGTLIVLLVLSSVAIIVRVGSVEGQVVEMANARNLSEAARQLEIHVLDYDLGVRAYLQSGDAKPLQEAAKEVAEVEQEFKEYERLAKTDRQRQMAARFAPLWQEVKKLGQALLAAEVRPPKSQDLKTLLDLRIGLQNLLADEIQVDALETYNARRDAALRGVRAIVAFALILLIVGVVIAAATSGAVGRGVVMAEGLVRANRELLRVTLASIGDAVITTDAQGSVTYLNAVAESLTGWKNDEAAGQPLETVFHIVNEKTRKPVENPATRALNEGVIVALANHTVLIKKDGTERPIDDNAAPIKDEQGKVVGVVVIFRDITERKGADDKLHESERRLRFIMDSMPQKIFTAKPSGDVDYFNPQWMEFTGLSFEQIKDWGWSQVIHPADVAENVRLWQHSIATGEPLQFEHRFRRADGEYRWHLSRAVPLRDAEGKVVMWVGSNTDVHEAKEIDRRRTEFLAMLAHELRNPLAAISNALQIMRMTGGDGKAGHPASGIVERQVGQMVRLVDDLLDASRISRGTIELRRGRVELASTINHAIETARHHCDRLAHELTVALPPQPIYVNADPTRLNQVVGNLLNNACKFTDKGGRISLSVEREGGQAAIRVTDSGIGIAAAQLPRVFDLFMQSDSSLGRAESGLGIGLALVKTMVEMHGGTVAAHSAGVGHGSEFVVRLPMLVETSAPPPPAPSLGEPATTTARRILIVDDNEDAATSLAEILRLSGHETHTARDGLEAVEAAAALRPDVVLLDLGLPYLNGFEVARRIREQPWGEHMVLVALTGWGQDEDRQRTTAAGFDGHLVKPAGYADIMKLLAELTPVGSAS